MIQLKIARKSLICFTYNTARTAQSYDNWYLINMMFMSVKLHI